ncbi:anhydro-N-acetylmuramic acid kinase [Niallia circulans]|uniref:Anhydro-N-acetylmuramic acid kinase n=1 Tax=Niallia circulans TaxID=1397 RepID=A0A553SR39_NIACI|nr:anhydro-N-acetylmuramic acid kinase AnmK [Niallia circulans]TRZ39456.1 anhydro-N-acetylmuramic acid kinase [Niallia circulans]
MPYAVGLMSGTSLDGVDAALVKIAGCGMNTSVELVEFISIPFSQELKKEIHDSLSVETSNSELICSLNFKLGAIFSDAVIAVCEKAGFMLQDLDYIGSHGQTIYHQPNKTKTLFPSTLQIGEPAVIAYRTKTTVISNFRTMDMAAGGQGAPLVPYTELILYGSSEKARILQNIGGVGNATVLPKNASVKEVQAFDTGPGNMIIDYLCQKFFGVPYDKHGEIAKSGNVNQILLEECMRISFILASPPKTTGRELFGTAFVEKLLLDYPQVSAKDFIATMTMFTAKSIAENYRKFIFPATNIDEVIVGGGGAFNNHLVHLLQHELIGYSRVIRQEDLGFSSEAKEAIAFAILANETINNLPSNVPKATGANQPVILGNITPVPY